MVKYRYVVHDRENDEIMADTNDKDEIIDMFAEMIEQVLDDHKLYKIPRNNNGTIPHTFENRYVYGDIITRLRKR